MTSDSLSPAPPAATEPADAVRRLLIGDSAAMVDVRRLIRLIAPTDAPVLLHGPTGSGKEVAARAIHAAAGDSERPFVAVNCGAIPAELIESELFGHEKGSFTGATDRRIGRFEAANGGTLFLDEIGDLPLAAQVRLLRVLEERSFERVGSTRAIPFTGRIICASHRDLAVEIAAGRFREDLWYRLAVLPITLPALRDRREDVPALAAAIARATGLPVSIDRAGNAALIRHDWPGNVRELRNILTRAAILFRGQAIGADVVAGLLGSAGASPPPCTPASADGASPDPDLKALLDSIERQQLIAALDLSHWTVADAARRVGMSRTTFIDRMRRHGLSRSPLILAA
jgi:sigma-54 dependent transcriptional regulator, flagellar regulatory protein